MELPLHDPCFVNAALEDVPFGPLTSTIRLVLDRLTNIAGLHLLRTIGLVGVAHEAVKAYQDMVLTLQKHSRDKSPIGKAIDCVWLSEYSSRFDFGVSPALC